MVHPLPLNDRVTDFEECVAAAPAAALGAARARAAALKRMVNASTDGPTGRRVAPDVPYPHPFGHREYYLRKWGATEGDCGYGNFEVPFNDARAAVGHWVFDAPRRRAFLDANGVSD